MFGQLNVNCVFISVRFEISNLMVILILILSHKFKTKFKITVNLPRYFKKVHSPIVLGLTITFSGVQGKLASIQLKPL